MKSFLRFVSVFFLFFLISCQSTTNLTCVSVKGYDDKMFSNGDSTNVKILAVIPLKTFNRINLYTIKKVDIVDSSYVIEDRFGVYVFDKYGNYLHRISQKGRAKNEYVDVRTFFVDNKKHINLVDEYSKKILVFDINGKFLREIKINKDDFSFVSDIESLPKSDELFINYCISGSQNRIYSLFDMKRNRIDDIVKTPLRTNNVGVGLGYHPFSIYHGRIRYIKPLDNRIYTYGSDIVLNIDTKKDIMSDEKLSTIDDFGGLYYIKLISKGRFIGFTDIFETSKYLILAYSNIEYIVIDKATNKCRRFYYFNSKYTFEGPELINVMLVKNERLIGVIEPDIDFDIKQNKSNELLYKTLNGKKSFSEPAIIEYSLN